MSIDEAVKIACEKIGIRNLSEPEAEALNTLIAQNRELVERVKELENEVADWKERVRFRDFMIQEGLGPKDMVSDIERLGEL